MDQLNVRFFRSGDSIVEVEDGGAVPQRVESVEWFAFGEPVPADSVATVLAAGVPVETAIVYGGDCEELTAEDADKFRAAQVRRLTKRRGNGEKPNNDVKERG